MKPYLKDLHQATISQLVGIIRGELDGIDQLVEDGLRELTKIEYIEFQPRQLPGGTICAYFTTYIDNFELYLSTRGGNDATALALNELQRRVNEYERAENVRRNLAQLQSS